MPINYKNLEKIKKNLGNASTHLQIITKTRSIEDIMELIHLGYRDFGENRVQEAKTKYDQIKNKIKDPINLSLVGPLQSNKVKLALKTFNCIQSIDREKIVDEISENLKNIDSITKDFFIQINIGNEPQKSGISEEKLDELYNYSLSKHINVVGLMCIPPNNSNPAFYFEKMKNLRDKLSKNLKLSMGMSADYESAIKFNSDYIRIGSLIFL